MAPDPFVPVVSTPVKLTTVSEAVLGRARPAVTDTLASGAAANARQISAVPRCTFVRTASCQVRPAPVTPVTVVFVPEPLVLPAETKASNNSLLAVVENVVVATVVALVDD